MNTSFPSGWQAKAQYRCSTCSKLVDNVLVHKMETGCGMPNFPMIPDPFQSPFKDSVGPVSTKPNPFKDLDIAKTPPRYNPDPAKGGIKFDENKTQLDLIPPALIEEVGKVMTLGAKKYAPYNWLKGMDFSRAYAAAQRHMNDWNKGEDNDPETGISHLAHAATCIGFLLEFQAQGLGNDDRFHKQVEKVRKTQDAVKRVSDTIAGQAISDGQPGVLMNSAVNGEERAVPFDLEHRSSWMTPGNRYGCRNPNVCSYHADR
jgi:hypothetical protein